MTENGNEEQYMARTAAEVTEGSKSSSQIYQSITEVIQDPTRNWNEALTGSSSAAFAEARTGHYHPPVVLHERISINTFVSFLTDYGSKYDKLIALKRQQMPKSYSVRGLANQSKPLLYASRDGDKGMTTPKASSFEDKITVDLIPKEYFESRFRPDMSRELERAEASLAGASTNASVTLGEAASPAALIANSTVKFSQHQIEKDRLEAYLSCVENEQERLIMECSKEMRSAAKYTKELHASITSTAGTIGELRSHSKTVVSSIQEGALYMNVLSTRRKNSASLLSTLEEVSNILTIAEEVDAFIQVSDHSRALHALDNAISALSRPPLDRINILFDLKKRLEQRKTETVNQLKSDFLSVVVEAMNDDSSLTEDDMTSALYSVFSSIEHLGMLAHLYEDLAETKKVQMSMEVDKLIAKCLQPRETSVKASEVKDAGSQVDRPAKPAAGPIRAGSRILTQGVQPLDSPTVAQGAARYVEWDTKRWKDVRLWVGQLDGTLNKFFLISKVFIRFHAMRQRAAERHGREDKWSDSSRLDSNSSGSNNFTRILDNFLDFLDQRMVRVVSLMFEDLDKGLDWNNTACIHDYARVIRAIHVLVSYVNAELEHVPNQGIRYTSALTRELTVKLVSSIHKRRLAKMNTILQKDKWAETKVSTKLQANIHSLQYAVRRKHEVDLSPTQPRIKVDTPKGYPRSKSKNQPRFITLDEDDEGDHLNQANGFDNHDAIAKNSEQLEYSPVFGPYEEAVKPDEQPLEFVMISGEKYKASASAVFAIDTICFYAHIESVLARIAKIDCEVTRRSFDIIRAFNISSSRQVLGANAIRTAGLKNLSARHLCTTSRSIALMESCATILLDYYGFCLSPESKKSMHFDQEKDKVLADLREHEEKLLFKVSSVMLDRLTYHCAGLWKMPWNDETLMRKEALPSDYIVQLLRETSILYQVMHATLPKPKMIIVLDKIERAYAERLMEMYDKLCQGNVKAAEAASAAGPMASAYPLPNTVSEWIRRRIETDVNTLYLKLRGWDVELESLGKTGIEELVSKYGAKSAGDASSRMERTLVSNAEKGREAGVQQSEAHPVEGVDGLSTEASRMEMEALVVTNHDSSMVQSDDTSEKL